MADFERERTRDEKRAGHTAVKTVLADTIAYYLYFYCYNLRVRRYVFIGEICLHLYVQIPIG